MPMSTPAQRLQADRLKFPGLLPEETLVLRAWLVLHESEYDRFDYNMRIGQGIDPGPAYTPEVRKQNIDNTQLRIDAVAFKGQQATIIEVKRRATASNVGQLLTYDSVWRKQFTGQPSPILRLVVNTFSHHILARVTEAGIHLDVVQVDFSGLKSVR
jgi:hypothetical protein